MKKILILDPQRSSLEKKKNIFTNPGFQVIGATSVEEARDILRGDTIDLLVSELDMPDTNGDDLCKDIRNNDQLKHISVVMIGFQSQAALSRCESCGVNAFLGKPLSHKELYSSVNELLNVHGRESYRVLVKVTIKGNARDESFFCNSQNLSVSGVLLETPKLLSKGDTITCAFFLRSNNISVNGEVVREESKPPDLYQYGIRFSNRN